MSKKRQKGNATAMGTAAERNGARGRGRPGGNKTTRQKKNSGQDENAKRFKRPGSQRGKGNKGKAK